MNWFFNEGEMERTPLQLLTFEFDQVTIRSSDAETCYNGRQMWLNDSVHEINAPRRVQGVSPNHFLGKAVN
jgi:hypothetical protein